MVRSSVGSNQRFIKLYLLLSVKHEALKKRVKTGWLGIRIVCPSGASCPTMLFQWASTINNQTKVVGLIQNRHYIIECNLFSPWYDISDKLLILELNTIHSLTNHICFISFDFERTWRVWRYQRGNQKPYIEEEQTTQWPIEKAQKDKQRSTKHTYKTKDRVTQTPLKTGGELRCSGRVSRNESCVIN